MDEDLAAFVGARLLEDEGVARAAGGGAWHRTLMRPGDAAVHGDDMTIYDEGGHSPEHAEHIARHDPARVLRAVGARWTIVDLYNETGRPGLHEAVVALATEYSDHPDYPEGGWQ